MAGSRSVCGWGYLFWDCTLAVWYLEAAWRWAATLLPPAVTSWRGCFIRHRKLCPLGCQILLPTRFLKADSHPPHHHIHPRRHQASFIPASGQRTPYFPSQLQISCFPLRSPTTPTWHMSPWLLAGPLSPGTVFFNIPQEPNKHTLKEWIHPFIQLFHV